MNLSDYGVKKEKPLKAVYQCPKCGYSLESNISSLVCFCKHCSSELVFKSLKTAPGVDPVKAKKKMENEKKKQREWHKMNYKPKRCRQCKPESR